jgi:hypothetical protein
LATAITTALFAADLTDGDAGEEPGELVIAPILPEGEAGTSERRSELPWRIAQPVPSPESSG